MARQRIQRVLVAATVLFLCVQPPSSVAQTAAAQTGEITVEGSVRDSAGRPLADVSVFLVPIGGTAKFQTRTDAKGMFRLSASGAGVYSVRAAKSGWRDASIESLRLSPSEEKQIDLVLVPSVAAASDASGGMEFEDKPNFTVAGVTDGTNAGGHGSGMSLQTSEALARETRALELRSANDGAGEKAENAAGRAPAESEDELRATLAQHPGNFEANRRLGEFYFASKRYREAISLLGAAYQINPGDADNAYRLAVAYKANDDFDRAREQARRVLAKTESAEAHRLLGDLDERMGDPLAAVHEYEQAVHLEPSEANYFAWGTELLLHGAPAPAMEVFAKGSGTHPDSARMLAGLGAALYASGSMDEAARRLCQASDLKPADPAPYIFLGQMENAAPTPLPCSEEKLERFARTQPENALANYYYGLAVSKRTRDSENSAGLQKAEALFEKAVSIDPKLGEAYLQLGILYAARGAADRAIGAYQKAIEANANLAEAHYRLANAFKRRGEEAKARQEFQLYQQAQKAETAALESQRRQLRQFLVILQ